jgi:hypothetical protein
MLHCTSPGRSILAQSPGGVATSQRIGLALVGPCGGAYTARETRASHVLLDPQALQRI